MEIRVDDPAVVKNCGEQISAKADEYQNQIKKIYSILDDLTNTWQGTRSQTFQAKMANCRKEFEKFGENLTNFGELVRATGDAYTKIENER